MRCLVFFVLAYLSLSLCSPSANDSPVPTSRDRFKWPFANYSIWNLPIGNKAKYVSANIRKATGAGLTVDPDVIILTPTAPRVDILKTGPPGCWDGECRCNATSTVMNYGVPIPSDYQLIDTDNNDCAAVLLADMNTIVQIQPLNVCKAGGKATAHYTYPNATLDGEGIYGAHGGSRLSSIGGTIRTGELVPGAGPIRHALKINLYALYNFYNNPTFRWPAGKDDSCAPACYNGTNPALSMGSLLALSTSINIDNMGLETIPGKMIAWTLQNYGGYVADNTAWNVYGLAVEQGPAGNVSREFLQWNLGEIMNRNKSNAWGRDMDRIFLNLSVVDNWTFDLYNNTVKISNGAQGAGGGAPLQKWAPAFAPVGATTSTTSSTKPTTTTTTTKSTTGTTPKPTATSSDGTTSTGGPTPSGSPTSSDGSTSSDGTTAQVTPSPSPAPSATTADDNANSVGRVIPCSVLGVTLVVCALYLF